MSNIINGLEISNTIINEIKLEAEKYTGIGTPGIAIIQIGNNTDSTIYINMKVKACKLVGFNSKVINFDIDVSDNTVYDMINNNFIDTANLEINKMKELNNGFYHMSKFLRYHMCVFLA